jgi:hypothetical protein
VLDTFNFHSNRAITYVVTEVDTALMGACNSGTSVWARRGITISVKTVEECLAITTAVIGIIDKITHVTVEL